MPKLVDFLLCEDARLEASGLVTLVGFFPGSLHVPGPGGGRLACVVVLEGMAGVERMLMQVEVILGAQNLYSSGVVECKRHPKSDGHLIVHGIPQLPIPAPGRYVVRITLEIGGVNSVYEKGLSMDMPVPQTGGGGPPQIQ